MENIPITSKELKSIPKYFRPSTTRLVFFSIITLGAYAVYWSYRNWDAIKVFDKDESQSPVIRAILIIFYIYRLTSRMSLDISDVKNGSYKYTKLFSIIYIVSMLVSGFVDILKIDNVINLAAFTFILYLYQICFLLIIQRFLYKNNNFVPLSKKIARGEIIFLIVTIVVFVVPTIKETVFKTFSIENPDQYYDRQWEEYQQQNSIEETTQIDIPTQSQ